MLADNNKTIATPTKAELNAGKNAKLAHQANIQIITEKKDNRFIVSI
jgi:hypothetical protein